MKGKVNLCRIRTQNAVTGEILLSISPSMQILPAHHLNNNDNNNNNSLVKILTHNFQMQNILVIRHPTIKILLSCSSFLIFFTSLCNYYLSFIIFLFSKVIPYHSSLNPVSTKEYQQLFLSSF
ncbi:Hypothetical predicted protein [Octopus vulgaris]|uniref:Uncharacterized protein n=1 Tax=Octopus vulgaris TaxID=6645 RepID=A0AA36F8K3_OCTVU|nr:Hypothetical predicted protein [Octopus vulgaris]